MFKSLRSESALLGYDSEAFKRQEQVFSVLNLFALATLFLSYLIFSSVLELPSRVFAPLILAFGLLIESIKLVQLRRRTIPFTTRTIAVYTWFTLCLNVGIALILTHVTDSDDIQYIVLMVVPILEAAVRFSLAQTMIVVMIADAFNFLYVSNYYRNSSDPGYGEYFEAAAISLIFTLTALLVWLLVSQLRQKEMHLSQNIQELERTRERLLFEEKLAAVGRLSSAIAHEIRNPVAIISSAVATATQEGQDAKLRDEMYLIAARESSRLAKLTADFLMYARPRAPQKVPSPVAESLLYIAEIGRVHAAARQVEILVHSPDDLSVEMESAQIQRALLNLVMNAIEASPSGGTVALSAAQGEGVVTIDVENAADAIAPGILERIFEPFFTTKGHGTGLGLAIARNIVRAHGGDLTLSANEPGRVCFSMVLPASSSVLQGVEGGRHGQCLDR